MPFYPKANETIEVSMMHQTSDLNYDEDEILQLLEMSYAGNELSMVILLPRETDGLQNLEGVLTVESLKEWSKNSYKTPVDVYLPRFKMTIKVRLTDVLKAMDMNDAFVMDKASFSGMDGNPHWLYIGFVLHKVFVDVSEEGTEAAAATVGGGCFPAGAEVLTFSAPRAIERVEAGTNVYACDLATGDWILTRVVKRQSYQ